MKSKINNKLKTMIATNYLYIHLYQFISIYINNSFINTTFSLIKPFLDPPVESLLCFYSYNIVLVALKELKLNEHTYTSKLLNILEYLFKLSGNFLHLFYLAYLTLFLSLLLYYITFEWVCQVIFEKLCRSYRFNSSLTIFSHF